MANITSAPALIRLGKCEIDLAAGHLRKHGVRLRLREQCLAVLAMLLEHPGQVVTRDELRRRLWPEDVFVDFDNNLNTAVARLREALGDSPEHPRFIETVPKRGYRFIADLSESPRAKPRLLVLPFANLSGDPAQEYFSDAITEDMIAELARLAPERLAVIARTTSMHYKGSLKEVARIGRELALDYVVEGSVRRADDRIAVDVQLIQVSDQTHLWTDRYDAALHDLFSIESTSVQAIAAQLGIVPARATKKPTDDLEAYNLHSQGRYYFVRGRPPENFLKAKRCYEEAVARDPQFALAYDSLGELYWTMGFLGLVPPKEALTTGIFHVLRALEIDNTLAETHALLAQYRKQLDYDWAEVRREMKRALELNPASPVVRLRYAITGLLPHGRIDEAVGQIERALESDPLDMFARCWLAETLHLGRQYDRGIEEIRRVLEIDPDYHLAHFVLAHLLSGKGRFDEAIAAHHRAVELSGGSPLMLGWLGLPLAQSGKAAEARAVLDRLHAIAGKAYVPPTAFAWIHLGLGETDQAFEWLDRAVDARDHMLTPIKSYWFLDPIRDDPRYIAILRRMRLEP